MRVMQSDVMEMMLSNDLCVLCTCKDDVPDASLMLYICDEHCAKLHMLTLEDTTKYRNIISNGKVSLLIDTRDAMHDKTAQTKALTVHGDASIVADPDTSKRLIAQLINRHDKLSNLANNKSVRVIEVLIKNIIYLENVDKVRDISLPDS